jgi:hypothetical protein
VGAGRRVTGSPLGGRETRNMIPAPSNIPTMMNPPHHQDLLMADAKLHSPLRIEEAFRSVIQV